MAVMIAVVAPYFYMEWFISHRGQKNKAGVSLITNFFAENVCYFGTDLLY